MAYSPLEIANTVITRHAASCGGIEHMKLQKILFYAYGWWLAYKGTPNMKNKPEVWKYGPVFSGVYYALNRYEDQPITTPEPLSAFDTTAPQVPANDTQTLQLIDWVWKRYGHFDSFTLSEMTHKPGTPWQIMAEKYNYRVPRYLEIDDEVTRTYFTALAQKEGVKLN